MAEGIDGIIFDWEREILASELVGTRLNVIKEQRDKYKLELEKAEEKVQYLKRFLNYCQIERAIRHEGYFKTKEEQENEVLDGLV